MFSNTSVSSLTKSIGYTKSRTYNFGKVKEDINSKKSRFKKKTISTFSPSTSSKSQTLLSKSPSIVSIEMGGPTSLPPIWVDIYEECQEKLKKIHEISREEQKLVAQRIKIQFGDHSEIDRKIEKKNSEATKLIHECEANLGRISKLGTTSDESESDSKIRKNIQKSLATQIQEATALLRRQQKGLLDKLQDINSTGSTEIDVDSNDYNEDLKEMMLAEDIAQERDEDINKLIDNINELNHVFKQMNQIVIEQGTIVDRIDYNIEQSLDNTVKAKKELVKAKKAMDSKCAQHVIRVQIILIFFFTVLLVFKFSK